MSDKIKSQRSQSQNSSECRVAFPFFHRKREKNAAGKPLNSGPRFDGTFLFPKLSADPSTCANYMFLYGLAVEAARLMWPGSVDAAGNWVWPQGAIFPVKDGDVPYVPKPKPGQPAMSPEEIAKKNAWRKGYWVVEATHILDPGPRIAVVQNGQLVEIPSQTVNGVQMYKSGDWGIANLHTYAYQNEQFGVNFGFEGFCFTRAGEAIGSSGPRSAAQMFGSVAGTAAPAAPAMPGAGAAPAAPPPVAPAAPAPAAPPMLPAAAPSIAPAAPPAMPPMPAAPAGMPPLPQR